MPRPLLERWMPWSKTSAPSQDKEAFRLPGTLDEGSRVLLVDSGDLCDLLVAMPFLLALKDQVPGAELGLVGDELAVAAAQATGIFDDLLVLDDPSIAAKGRLPKEMEDALAEGGWTMALFPGRGPDTPREALVAASKARLRIGPGHRNAWPAINCELQGVAKNPWRPGRMKTLGGLLGIQLEDDRPQFPLAGKRARQVAQLIHFNKPRPEQKLVGVDPGLGKEGGRLSVDNLAFVVNHLANHVQCKTLMLTTDPSDPHADELASQLRGDRLELPRKDLGDVLHLLAHCDLLLAGNTDLFHLAGAMGVPALGIFTPADLPGWKPREGVPAAVLPTQPGEPLPLAELMAHADSLLAG